MAQIDAYFWADLEDRNGTMIKFKINHQISRGISTTRGSLKNSRKYLRKAPVVGESGVPRLQSKTAVVALFAGVLPWVNLGSG